MERFLPRIWVFVVAFCLGITVAAVWRIYTLPDYELPPPPEPVIEETIEAVRLGHGPKLVEGGHQCGAAGPEGRTYNYNDGGWVRTKCRRFKSSWAAMREYLDRMKGATIEERALINDGNGSQTGEEVLLLSPQLVRIRMEGRLLCEVEASSLFHLKWFERR